MSELENNFLDSIDLNSERQQNITENEWNKINKDKTQILSKVSDSKKIEFESKYQELDNYFKQEGEQIHKTKAIELKLFKDYFKLENKSNSDVKNELISKYSNEYKNLQSDVVSFLNKSFNNSLDTELRDFNIDKFNNKDKKEGFSKYELEQYAQILDKAMNDMNILGSYSDFKKQYKDTNKEPDFLSWKGDIALANNVDLQEYVFGKGEKHLTDKLHNYSEEELHSMREEKFDITDGDKMKNFIILLGLELGDGVQDILKFIGNIPAGIIILPRYINNRVKLSDDKINTKEEVEAQMENDMLLKENPSLMLCELLGEKGIQMIKKLGEMFVSGKNGDIAMVLVTIAGLIAGGAGVVKLMAKGGKIAGTAMKNSKIVDNALKIEKGASKLQKVAEKIDDFVLGAGIGHILGKFKGNTLKGQLDIKFYDDLIKIDKDGTLSIQGNEIFNKISGNELEKVILNNIVKAQEKSGIKVTKVDISKFNDVEHKYLKEKIFTIIGNNFPLIEIGRLQEGARIVDITFLGVKDLNDKVSKEFVDLFNGKLKEYFSTNFDKYSNGKIEHGRAIRDNYKHMTFSMHNDIYISKAIFGNIKDKGELLGKIFKSIDDNDLKVALKDAKIKNKGEVEKLLKEYFDFGIGSTIVEKRGNVVSMEDKLSAFYKAEISSRNKVNFSKLGENLNFDFKNIQDFSYNIIHLEREIINKYEGKSFRFNNTDFDIIVDGKINNILLRYIRKGEDIGDKELANMVKKYIVNLNDGFDFIAPFINKNQLNEVKNIEDQITNGIINIKLFEKNYKDTLSIKTLKAKSKGKKGLRVFVDIVDMGIMNLSDFRDLALKVNSGKININNMDELLLAGSTVTKKFQNLVKSLKYKYKDIKISLGGDEIFIFIPGKTEKESAKIIENITNSLKQEELAGRISSSIIKNNEKIFDNLDGFTLINKTFEKLVEKVTFNNPDKIIINNNFINGGPKSLGNLKFSGINLNIAKSNQKFVSENLVDIIIGLRKDLDENIFKKLLSGEIDKYKFSIDINKRNKDGVFIKKIRTIKLDIEKGKNIEEQLILNIK